MTSSLLLSPVAVLAETGSGESSTEVEVEAEAEVEAESSDGVAVPKFIDARKEAKANAEIRREDRQEEREARREEIKANNEERRETIKATIETRREEIKANMETRREEWKQKMEERKAEWEARREELKTKLAEFKDRKKAEIAARIAENLNSLNERITNHFSDVLVKLTDIMIRVSAGDVDGDGATDITAANAAIVDAQASVDAQAVKTYSVEVSTEATVKVDVGNARQQLHGDLKAVWELVKSAREAVRQAASHIDKPEVEASADAEAEVDADE